MNIYRCGYDANPENMSGNTWTLFKTCWSKVRYEISWGKSPVSMVWRRRDFRLLGLLAFLLQSRRTLNCFLNLSQRRVKCCPSASYCFRWLATSSHYGESFTWFLLGPINALIVPYLPETQQFHRTALLICTDKLALIRNIQLSWPGAIIAGQKCFFLFVCLFLKKTLFGKSVMLRLTVEPALC